GESDDTAWRIGRTLIRGRGDADRAGAGRIGSDGEGIGCLTEANPHTDVVTVAIETIDGNLVGDIAFGGEGYEAGIVTSAFVVAGDFNEVGQSVAGVN